MTTNIQKAQGGGAGAEPVSGGEATAVQPNLLQRFSLAVDGGLQVRDGQSTGRGVCAGAVMT
jgi:hypothetical protein